MPRIKKSIWIPLCLLAYMGIMTAYFASDWITSGQSTRLYLTIAAETVIIILLAIFLRKREKI